MLIREILTERIALPPDIVTALNRIIQNWIEEIRLNTGTFSTNQEVINQYNRDTRILSNQIHKIIWNILAPNMNIDRRYSQNDFQLTVKISPKFNTNDPGGAIYGNWELDAKTNRLDNVLFCKLTYKDYLKLLDPSESTTEITQFMIDIITHETTHLIQSLRARDFTIHNKAVEAGLEGDLSTNEIDSYAQSFVSNIIQTDQVDQVLSILRSGNTQALSPHAKKLYTTYHDLFLHQPHDLTRKEQKGRVSAWKRFNKRIYEKLQDYLEQTGSV